MIRLFSFLDKTTRHFRPFSQTVGLLQRSSPFALSPAGKMPGRLGWSLLCCLFLLAIACRTKKEVPRPAAAGLPGDAVLLDSATAATVIVVDTVERFFERVGPADVSLQLKDPLTKSRDRAALIADYKTFLQQDVADFTPDEAERVRGAMRRAYAQIAALNPNLYPSGIQLLKTKGKHYGDGVYYTRQDAIIIPANELGAGNEAALQSVLIHEIFHVWSRNNRAQRDSLYALIGFEPLGVPVERMTLPAPLRDRMLLNPDGINYAYTIELQRDGKPFRAVPMLIAEPGRYTTDKKGFFRYLQFQLFELEERRGGLVLNALMTDTEGRSTLDMGMHPEFSAQIGDNTGYIIHPEEIIAENFRLLVEGDAGSGSERGKALLADVRRLLQGF